MKTIEKIKLFIDYKELSYTKFDRLIGAGVGYIGKQIKNNASIGTDVVQKIIANFPELNPLYLILDDAEMLKTDNFLADTPAPNRHYGSATSAQSAQTPTLKEPGGAKYTAQNAPPSAPPSRFLAPQIISVNNDKEENILYVPVRAAAGYLNGFADPTYMETLPAFNLPGLKKKTYRAFQIDGESMVPTLENKEIIIGEWIERLEDIKEDHVHVLITKTRGVIAKRLLNRVDKYGYIIAKSDALDNRKQYPDIEVYPDEIEEIWFGVAHINYRFRHPTDTYKRINNMEADLTEIMRVLKQSNLM